MTLTLEQAEGLYGTAQIIDSNLYPKEHWNRFIEYLRSVGIAVEDFKQE